MARIGGFGFRIGIVAVCVIGFHAVADSAILQGVGQDSIEAKVLIAESLAVIPGDGRQVAAFTQSPDHSASLLFFDFERRPRSFYVGVDESGASLITAKGSSKDVLRFKSSNDDPSSLFLENQGDRSCFHLGFKKDRNPHFGVLGNEGQPRISIQVLEAEHDTVAVGVWGARGPTGINLATSPVLSHATLADGGGDVRSTLGRMPVVGEAEFSELDATSTARIRFCLDNGRPAVIFIDPERRDAPFLH